ncbi:LacI family DNA-binding transcriptional regulator [Primorskyibacter sp. S187A]|uniref:LacI family DNA-binding transcriptional regulator n=1 Tax=Primorskyibacter sp. S187A TaxID=3415130 RepID=UPI003C79C165
MSDPKIKNMDEFAAVVGISRPTLSKYFQNPDKVRISTRERIEAGLKKFDYRPNVYAINQNRQMTRNVGIIVPFLADPFFSEIARRIERRVIEAGYQPLLMNSHGDPETELENLKTLRTIKPAGTLIAPLGRVSKRDAIEEYCEDVATVVFDSNLNIESRCFIGSDNVQFVRETVEYLSRTGEAPCFYEMRTPANPNAQKRRQAYIDTMEQMGQEPQIIQVVGEGWDFEEISYREGLNLLDQRAIPSSTVLCSNDRLAIGLLSACYEKGYRVGRGNQCAFRVAGMDDHPFSRYTCPSLTTMAHDYDGVSTRSVDALLALLSDPDSPDHVRQETLCQGKLIMRSSA